MLRIFISSQNISGDKIIVLNRSEAHYLKDVLRLKKNQEITAFDEKGNGYICSIEESLNSRVILEIRNKLLSKRKKINITVACAIPKKSKMDDIIDKLTQLGVDRIIPLLTKRVVIKLDKQKEILRQERWRKIAQNASQQSQRDILPLVDHIKELRQVLWEAKNFDLKLIPTLSGERKSLKEAFGNLRPNNILILIGPEGDFTDEEVDLAVKCGCIPVTLGESVLRVETAAVCVASFIRLYGNS